MVILTVAGVTPEDGVMVIPGALVQAVELAESARQTWNGTAFPEGSAMSIVCVIAPELQKLPRNTTSSSEAVTRGALSNCAIGKTVTPLSEMEYSTLSSELKTAFPARFSGIWMRSRTLRLSASITIRLDGAVLLVGAVVPGVVVVTQIPLSKHWV